MTPYEHLIKAYIGLVLDGEVQLARQVMQVIRGLA